MKEDKLNVSNIYFEFDDNFNGSCCFIVDWLTFDAFVALYKWAGGAFDTGLSRKNWTQNNNKRQLIQLIFSVF